MNKPEESKTPPTLASVAQAYAASSGITRNERGHIDLMKAVGGTRGLAESLLPGFVFLAVFVIVRSLPVAVVGAVAVAAVFTIWRLVQRQSVVQAFSGLVGVGICAWFSDTTGRALDYYVPGFWINVVSIVVVLGSILARWPVAGVVFGFIRGENVEWRSHPLRLRAYLIGSWIILALFALRLAVQLPLYFADNVVALGITRLLMGVPLYALALWLAWVISRPAAVAPAGATDAPAAVAPGTADAPDTDALGAGPSDTGVPGAGPSATGPSSGTAAP